jgi:uncharacterized protein with HEPN domain
LKAFEPYLFDILDRIVRIRQFIEGHDYHSFCADDKTSDAVIRNIEIIGEAVRHVPEHIRQKYPDIQWRQIAGMRDKLIHDYLGVDLEYVWNVASKRLEELETAIKRVLQEEK